VTLDTPSDFVIERSALVTIATEAEPVVGPASSLEADATLLTDGAAAVLEATW
jgi:hypothetical protein